MILVEKDPDQAMKEVSDYLNEHPNSPDALATAAFIDIKCERFGLAWAFLDKALKVWPRNAPLLNNLGMCALGCMRLDDAENILKRALKIDPSNVPAMNNLALVYVNKCEPLKSIELIDQADKLAEKDSGRTETRGYAALLLGNYREGWRDFEAGLNGKIRRPRGILPYWDGSPVKTLVVRGEQGIGDEISFSSVISSIKNVENIVIECDKRLEKLFERSFPDCNVYGTRFEKTAYWMRHEDPQAEILMGSLCQYYRNEQEDFPRVPYLISDPERTFQWRCLLKALGDKKKIGIAWTGGKPGTHNIRRSLDLESMLPILKQDATFISLQYKECQEEIDNLYQKHGIKVYNWPRATQTFDYDDTVSLIDSLDMVITVQTAIVHTAGALGKPVWAMIPSKPLWRYKLQGRFDWCESVKLYRQKKDWSSVINTIAEDLRDLLSQQSTETS